MKKYARVKMDKTLTPLFHPLQQIKNLTLTHLNSNDYSKIVFLWLLEMSGTFRNL